MSNIKYSSKRGTASKIKRTVKRPIKKLFLFLNSKSPQLRSFYKEMKLFRRRKRFEKYSNISVDNKLIVFESFTGLKYADSPKAIYEYMLNSPEYSEYRFVWCLKDRCMDEYLFLEKNDRTQLLLWGSPEYYEAYAKAGYWITNSRINNVFEVKPDQVYVQCWHGTPFKRLGFDIEVSAEDAKNSVDVVKEWYQEDARRYTYMLSPSRYCSEKFISAFNLKEIGKENIIIEEGYPRNDYLINYRQEDIRSIKSRLGISEDKKVILYAPTWRDNQHEKGFGYVYESPIDFNHFKDIFEDDYVILFRAHYFIASHFDFSEFDGFVIDVSLYSDINDLYIVSDILITDYSSVFFDFGILKRPIIFYMYDFDYYANDLRGFYLLVDDLPGPVVKTQSELETSLKELSAWAESIEYIKQYEQFTNRFTYLDDGHATERVVKRVFDK